MKYTYMTYRYWVLKFPDTNLYVGKRTDSEPCSEVERSGRVRYNSIETARRAVQYFAGWNIKVKIVRVVVKCKRAPKRSEPRPQARLAQPNRAYPERKPENSWEKHDHLRYEDERPELKSAGCKSCGPMSSCICHEDDLPTWGALGPGYG